MLNIEISLQTFKYIISRDSGKLFTASSVIVEFNTAISFKFTKCFMLNIEISLQPCKFIISRDSGKLFTASSVIVEFDTFMSFKLTKCFMLNFERFLQLCKFKLFLKTWESCLQLHQLSKNFHNSSL
uniref:Uncharacterized protein n=1 Tax=Cacopsylla melanoneura TaxID=428564 RepID=A0A8D9ELW0_9HEMI